MYGVFFFSLVDLAWWLQSCSLATIRLKKKKGTIAYDVLAPTTKSWQFWILVRGLLLPLLLKAFPVQYSFSSNYHSSLHIF